MARNKSRKGDLILTNRQDVSIEQIIINIVNEVLNRTIDLHNYADLRSEGLDSLKTIELIVCLEGEFGIEIDDEDLLVENFSSITNIVKVLSEKYIIY